MIVRRIRPHRQVVSVSRDFVVMILVRRLKPNLMKILSSLAGVHEMFEQPTGTESQQIDLYPAFFYLDNSPAMIILYCLSNLISDKGWL
jgi:hypothetical protein